jgi:hypothetical protein
MDLVAEITNSIEGLKIQSMIANKSKGLNSEVDKKELSKAHDMISPYFLSYDIVKDYMNLMNLESFIDIDIEDFKEWVLKNFNYDHSELTILSITDKNDTIHLCDAKQKLNEDDTLQYMDVGSFSFCSKKLKSYGPSTLNVKIDNLENMKIFFEEQKEDFSKLCPDCAKIAYNL